jgi:hypothetical protein
MTHNNLLDAILSSYLFGQKLKLAKDPRYKKLSFNLVAKAQDPTIDDWNIEFLRKRLFDDGFLENAKYGDPEPYELTPAGIKAAQIRWYSSQAEEKRLDKEIKEQTLLSLKRSKTALTISIFAFIIPTLISLYSLWTNKESATTEELQQLQKRIEKLESSKTESKTTSNVSEKVSADTTQKVNTNK